MEKQEPTIEQQALAILINAARLAQSKGVFTLEDAEVVSQAIKVFLPPTQEETEDEQNKPE